MGETRPPEARPAGAGDREARAVWRSLGLVALAAAAAALAAPLAVEAAVAQQAGAEVAPPVVLTPDSTLASTPAVLHGTAAPGADISVNRSSATIASAQADPTSGYWRLDVPLVEGLNELEVAAAVGGVSSAPSRSNLVLDTTPPTTPVILNPAGESAPSRMHVIRGTAEPSSLVEVYVNGTLGGSASAYHGGAGPWFIQVLLGAGSNNVTARAVDGIGNPSALSSVLITAPNVRPPSSTLDTPPVPTSAIADDEGAFTLTAPTSVKAFESGGKAYAVVAAGGSAAVQIVDFTDPRRPEAVKKIQDDSRHLGLLRDIELFTDSDGKRIAAVTSLSPGAVELIDMTDPTSASFVGAARIGSLDEGGASLYPQLLGARDAAVFNATVNGTAGTYIMVVSDYGPTALNPGGFQIINVTHTVMPTPASENHAAFRDGEGRHVMARPPTAAPGVSPTSTTALHLGNPEIIATFDDDGHPVARTANVTLPGYSRNFSVPVEGLYTANSYSPNPTYSLGIGVVIEVRNSTDHIVSRTLNGRTFLSETCNPGPHLTVCSSQHRLIKLDNNDTPSDKTDDYIIEVYRDGLHGAYGYPLAKLIGGKMLSVDVDGSPFPLRGVDPDGSLFEALEGARSVDTFTTGGSTYAVVAARDADAVQIINVTDPSRPRVAAEARDGRLDANGVMFDKLDGASGVGIAQIGGSSYAVVAAQDDNGVQIIDVTDPSRPLAGESIADVSGSSRKKFSMLGGATSVEIFVQSSRTYALVSSWEDDGFQVIDITDPSNPVAADRGHDGNRCSTAARYSALGGATASDTLAMGGRLYALIAANFDDGMQVVDITDPTRLVVRGAMFDELGGFSELHEPISAEAVEIGGRSYVLVASYTEYISVINGDTHGIGGSVQIMDVTDPASPRAASALRHSDRSQFDLLLGVRDIDTFVVGARTYAIITAESPWGATEDDDRGAFTIVDISDPDRPRFVSGARDGQRDTGGNKFDMLNAPARVDTAKFGDKTYAVIAARGPTAQDDHGVQIIDVTNPRFPLAVGSARDGGSDGSGGTFSTLYKAHGVDIVQVGSRLYALVTSIAEDGVQIIEITDPARPRATASIDNGDPNTQLNGANAVKAFEKGGYTYAIVASKHGDSLQMLNISNPASPDPIDSVVDVWLPTDGRGFTEIKGAYDISLFTLNGEPHAIVSCESDGRTGQTGPFCNGVQIVDMSNPARITGPTRTWDGRDVNGEPFTLLRGARGVATFTAGASTYAAATGYLDDGVEIMRLVSGTDTTAPSAVKVDLNQERGLLYISFDELVKTTSGNINLQSIRITNATGSLAAVPLTGAQLAGESDGKTIVIALTDSQKTSVAAFSSPVVAFTSAGAFEDLAANDLPARAGIVPEIVTSRPTLLEARLDLGTGEVALGFTEAIDASEVDVSRIAVYSSDAPRVRYSPSAVVTEGSNPELTVRLGLHARQAAINFTGAPLVDVLDGAANSSETGRPSSEYRGSTFKPVLADRVDPRLVSASLDGRLLSLVFDEYVDVRPSKFDLDQMHLRDGAGSSEVSLNGADLLTARNGTTVLVSLTAQQAEAAAGYARIVLDMRLSGAFSAVEDLSGQGIGAVRGFAVSTAEDRTPPAFSATATALNRIAVSFTEVVSGTEIGPDTVWSLAGLDGIGYTQAGGGSRIALEIVGYGGVSASDSLVLELNGFLPSTRPDISLVYNGSGDIADGAGNALPLNTTVRVADGIAPNITSAAVTGPNAVTLVYSELVRNPRSALSGLALAPGGARTIDSYAPLSGGTDVITFLGSAVQTSATGTLTVDQTGIVDLAGNAMGSQRSYGLRLSDGQGPAIVSAAITYPVDIDVSATTISGVQVFTATPGTNNVTIRYSEPASAPLSAYSAISLDRGGATLVSSVLTDTGGGARTVTGLSGNTTDTHVVTFGGDTVALGAAGAITINAVAVLDSAPRPNPLAVDAALSVPLSDGRATDLVSAKITGPNIVTITYSEGYVAHLSTYGSLAVGGQARMATGLSGASVQSTAHTITFGGDPAPANATGMIAMDASNVLKQGGVKLGSAWLISVLEDGQAPSIGSSAAVSDDTIRVVFDEPVSATGASGAGWSVSGGDSDGLSVSASSDISGGSTVVNITLDGTLPDTRPDGITLSYAAPASGGIVDAAGNAPAALSIAVGDGLAPYIASATVSGPTEATVRYSEPVNASSTSAYPTVTLGTGDTRTVTSLSGNGTAAHVLTFGGADAAVDATGRVVINEALIEDAAGNRLGDRAALSHPLTDGQAPRINSAAVTAPDKATIVYSRAVSALPSVYTSLVVDGAARTISSVSGNTLTNTHVITFSPGGAPPSANGSVAIDAASVADENSVQLGAGQVSQDLADGQAPSITNASATSLTTIRVAFDEPVTASSTAGTGWTISGANASGRTVVSISDASSPAAVINLTLSGELAGTRPDGVTLSYASSSGGIVVDVARNLLQARMVPVGDGIAPEIESAAVRAGHAAEVVYTEPVYIGASAYAGLGLSPGGDRGAPSVFTGNGSATHVLTFGDSMRPETAAAANATGTLTVNQTALADAYGNPLGDNEAFSRMLADGQAPGVASAAAVSLREILVTFDEPVSADGTSGAADWSVSGGDAASRAVSSRSDVSAGSATLTLTLDGDLADDSPSGITLSYTPGTVAFADAAGNALGSVASQAVADGIAPRIVSAKITAGNTATIEYSESVAKAPGAYSALSLVPGGSRNPTGPTGTPSATHTITFDGAEAATSATGSITMNQTALVDEAGNALGDNAAFSQPLADGQAPEVLSANVTGPNALSIVYSEPVTRVSSAYSALTLSPGGARTATGPAGTPLATHAISFGGAAAATSATGTLTVDQTALADAAGNALGSSSSHSQALADGQAPSVTGAEADSLREIRVTLSEPVLAAGTDGAGGWAISGAEAASRAVSGRSDVSAGSATLTLTLDGDLADDSPSGITLSYTPGTVAFADAAGNALGSVASQAVADGIAPRVLSANITASNALTITYSEPVTRVSSAYSALSLTPGGSRTATGPAGMPLATHAISFGGAAAATNATGSIAIDQTALADAAGNALGTDAAFSLSLADGQAPGITGGAVTAANALTITYSEPVTAPQAAYSSLALSAGGTPTALALSGGTSSAAHTITFSSATAAASATGTISVDETQVADASGNALGSRTAFSQALADGQAPSVTGAEAVSLTQISVEFDEPVLAAGTDGAGGWAISGAEAASRAVSGRSDVSAGSAALTLTLDGSLADDSPSGIMLSYTPGTVAFADAAGNALGSVASQAVADGIAPRVLSASITASNALTITYSESVAKAPGAYSALSLVPGGSRTATGPTGTPSPTHTVTFSGAAAATSATGTLTMDQTVLVDAASNALGASSSHSQALADGQAPEVLSANVTGPNALTIVYSEPVTRVSSAYSALSLVPGGSRTATGPTGTPLATHAISFGGAAAATNATGSIAIDQTALADAAGNALGSSSSHSQALADGQAPAVLSANVSGPNALTIVYSEPVTRVSSAYSALSLVPGGSRTATGPTGTPSATHTVTFSGAAAATSATGTVGVDQTALADAAGNALGTSSSHSQALADGQAPTIEGGAITAGNTLTITYSEPVVKALSAYSGLALSPGGSRTPTGIPGDTSASHAITFGGGEAATNATGSITLDRAALADAAGNALGTGTLSQALADGQRPKVERSAITGAQNLTITYSEPVAAPSSAYVSLALLDTIARTITTFTGNSSAAHVVVFTGTAAPLGATGTITIDATAVRDLAPSPNAMGASTAASVMVHDDRAPSIVTARVTAPGSAEIMYSRTVTAQQAHYTSLTVDGASRAISGLAGGTATDTHTISFTPADAPPNATGSVAISAASVLDEGGRQLGAGPLTQALADGQAPSMSGATAVSPTQVRVEFDEAVSADAAAGHGGWSVSGGDAAGLSVSSRSDISSGSTRMTLTLSGSLPDTRPDGITLSYTEGSTGSAVFKDDAENEMGNESTGVGDGIAPVAVSANITAGNELTVVYSEPVGGAASAYSSLALSPGGSRTATGQAGAASETHTVAFSGDKAATNATGTLTVNRTALADESGNAPAGGAAFEQAVADGQPPVLLSARIAGPSELSIAYSEAVRAGAAAYSAPALDSGRTLAIASVSGLSAVHTISLAGAPVDATNATGSIVVDEAALADLAGNALGDDRSRTVGAADGQRPELVSSIITGGNTVTVRYSEPVAAPLSAYARLDLASDGSRAFSSLAGNSTPAHAVVFAGSPAMSNAVGNITIDERAVVDTADPPNSLGTSPARMWQLADDRNPSIVSAEVTGPDRATIRYDRPVSAPQSAYSSIVVDGLERNMTAPLGGNNTRTHHVYFAPGGAPPNATGTVVIDESAVHNADGGTLGAGPANRTLADGQAPEILGASIAGPNTAAVVYSEPVARQPGAYSAVSLEPGGSRAVGAPAAAAAASPTHAVSFGGAPAAANATGLITIDQTALADAAGNRLGTSPAFSRALADGQAPSVASARITAGNELAVLYTEPVAGPPSAYAGLVLEPGGARSVEGPAGAASDAHTVAFNGSAAAPNATGALSIDQTALADAAGNRLGAEASHRLPVSDGQDPSFRATAVSTGTILVEFDEPVAAAGTSGPGGWSVSGGDAAGLSVSSRSDISSGSAELTLTLSGSLPDTAPDGVVLSYERGTALAADAAGNEPAPRGGSGGAVLDGIAPAVASASVSGANAVAVSYTEPVTASADPPAYSALELDHIGARDILGFTAGRAALHTIEFGGAPVLPDAEGGIAIDLSLVTDAAGNAAGAGTVRQGLAAGQAPPVLVAANASAAFTTPNTVVVTYSHGLGRPPSAAAGPVYGGVTVEPAGGSSPSTERDVVSESGIGTSVHTVRFGGPPVRADSGGSIELLVDLQAGAIDAARALHWREAGPIPVLPGEGLGTVVVGPSGNGSVVGIVHDSFERRVNATAGGENATVAIDVSGLVRPVPPPEPPAPGAGGPPPPGAGPAAVFPAGVGVTIVAEFAEVSFPPNVTARELPADGLLELYVAPPSAVPNASALADAFGHGDPGTLAVGRVVEVGDDGTHIVFDLPVRILLAGQAGGRAFYVNGTDGAIVPIGAACGADDTAAVHAQLGGAGECQIDSAGDKVIHTYHLTLFGTVRIPAAPGSGPPVVVAPGAPAPPGPPHGSFEFFGGGGAGGSGRGGGGGGGGGGGSPLPEGAGAAVALHSAAWDCGDGTVRIAVSAAGGAPEPTVAVLSSGGSAEAGRVASPEGPPGLLAYEAPLPDDDIFSIRAVSVDGRSVSTASEAVRTGGACAGEAVFSEYAGGRAAQAGALQQGGPGDGAAGGAGDAGDAGDAAAGGPPPGATAEPEPSAAADGGAQAGAGPETRGPQGGGEGAGDGAAFEMEEGRGAAHYVGQYAEDSEYREWFASAYPQYADICEAVGAAPGCVEAYLEEAEAAPASAASGADGGDASAPPPAVKCRDGMVMDGDGRCVPDGGAEAGTVAPGGEEDAAPEPGAGCLIATAAYGTELAPQVQALREYRDGTLLATAPGSAFMSAFSAAYYAFSPHVADLEREHPAFRHAVAALIAPMLYTLQAAAHADPGSEASVVAHGAAAVLLVAGLYVGMPAAGAALAAAAVRRRGRQRQRQRQRVSLATEVQWMETTGR